MFEIDLHVHTRLRSHDSSLTPEELVAEAKRLGQAAICITEHNDCWTADEARRLSEIHGIPVLRGMEIGTDVGHVLAFGIGRFTPEMFRVDALRLIADSQGAALVLAHPMRPPGFGRPLAELVGLFDGYEVLNGDESRLAAHSAEAIARQFGLATTGGSDAHSRQGLGRCHTVFETVIGNDYELSAAIRARRTRATVTGRVART